MQPEMDKPMKDSGNNTHVERLLVVSRDASFCMEVRHELESRRNPVPLETVGTVEEACKTMALRPPTVILLEESLPSPESEPKNGIKPTLWAAATSLSEFAPLVVIGCAEHQAGLTALLAAGQRGLCDTLIILFEDRNRPGGAATAPVAIASAERWPDTQSVLRPRRATCRASEFGEILRHELNNPLTGILGNAELLLVDLQRKNIELPKQSTSQAGNDRGTGGPNEGDGAAAE